jgi:hypothetical protein
MIAHQRVSVTNKPFHRLQKLLARLSLRVKRVNVRPDKPGKRQTKGSSKPSAKRDLSPKGRKGAPVKAGRPDHSRKTGTSRASPKAIPIHSRGARKPQNPLKRMYPAALRVWKDGIKRLRTGLKVVQASGQEARLIIRKQFARKAKKSTVRLGTRPLIVRPTSARNESAEIHLLGEIEHRCPFCLEIVEENDPRGVKICKICHTRHHADCWDVTGTCQVPHHYG